MTYSFVARSRYWPGTHTDMGLFQGHGRGGKLSRGSEVPELPTQGRFPSDAMIAAWEVAHGPPKRTYCRRGDAIIRNPRVWHRGTANRSQIHRVMVSCGHGVWRRPSESSTEATDTSISMSPNLWRRPEWQRRVFGSQIGAHLMIFSVMFNSKCRSHP